MLFSEPKIPQFKHQVVIPVANDVSVLFSEPKIPQWEVRCNEHLVVDRFSALQRAENSSIGRERPELNGAYIVSVLFSEPKIPQ